MDQLKQKDSTLNQLVRTQQQDWRPLNEPGITGVWIKVLRFDDKTQRSPTILLRFEPGATYPAHNHPGGEEIFVIEGDINLGPNRLGVGDYLYTAPGNTHAVHSVGGCVILLSAPEEVEILRRDRRKSTDA